MSRQNDQNLINVIIHMNELVLHINRTIVEHIIRNERNRERPIYRRPPTQGRVVTVHRMAQNQNKGQKKK